MREIHKLDPEYPANLKAIDGAPEKLFVKGELLKSDKIAIAIVGTRTPSRYGMQITEQFATELAKAGFTIVSGMARGIDSIAHKASIKAGGRTIAVLANGLDMVYPPENVKLFREIIKNGAIFSEFRPGVRPLPKHFLARNRIISGLCLGVLVIEGRRRSGTLSTATHAANQGREVFAVPGPIKSKQSEAPNYLIENGAMMVKSPQDILDTLG